MNNTYVLCRYQGILSTRNKALVITLLLCAVVLGEGAMGSEVPASPVLYSQFLYLPLRLLHLCTFASLFVSLPATDTSASLRSQPHYLHRYSQRSSYTVKDPVVNDGR